MSEPKVDTIAFKKRVSSIQKKIERDEFGGAKSMLVVIGSADEENPYQKSSILHSWILGYEFPATIIYITKEKTIFITSSGKAKYLAGVKNASVDIWTRTKDVEHNKQLFDDLVTELKKDNKIGILPKDKYQGKFMTEWTPIWDGVKDTLDLVDVTVPLSQCIELKDDKELNITQMASKSSVQFMDFFQNEMVSIVDEELKVSHSTLSEKVEAKIDEDKFRNQLRKKLGDQLDTDQLDWCYTPIVQSGGKYDLKPSAQSNDDNLHGGVVIASLGVRYKSYCSNIGRTFLIDPTPEVDKNYEFLLQVEKKVLSLIKPGAKGSQIYNDTIEFIKSERPDLEKHFTKNVGWLIGLEFRDSSFLLNAKNERSIPEKATFDVTVGFNNLTNTSTKDSKSKTYSLLLSDTVKIQDGKAVLLTEYLKNRSDVSFYFKDETEDVKKEVDDLNDDVKPKREPSASTVNSKILKSKLRTETKNHDENDDTRQKQIQKELHEKRQREGLQRFSDTVSTDADERKVVFKKYESYVRETQIPSMVKDLRIHVDYKTNTILIPISGRPVPFHINSYKNGSKSDEGEYTLLRLNFNSPGVGGNTSKKDEIPYEDDGEKQFIRNITLRSKDHDHMARVFKEISDLKKESVKREADKKNMADVVAQARLIEAKAGRLRRLDNVFARPMPDSKRVPGSLSIHENGLRYQSPLKPDSKIDVLFSNIKHLFFQPCKDEMYVIIHVNLKTPLIIGKKKTFDVQFYREATDIVFDETNGARRGGARRRYGDDDELEQEQEERRKKAALDKEFRKFGELIADASGGAVDLDIPFRELGFNGVSFRASAFLMPTRDCLVQLMDPPFLVVTLEEVEVAHLERVQFGLKNFDMVFVFKDFKRPVVHINTIPIDVLEDIKSWLTDVDIPFSESTINLNWVQIMKTLQSDPKQFFLDGGWSFLAGDSDAESATESEEESEFEASDLDPSDEEVESEDDYSEGGDDDSGSDFSGDDDEESEGEDWDELDKKAAREDAGKDF
ncbi:CYFA0S09e01970g1_1 [Cyberlindnera fabianii]|uniref:FACT complex subunit n=1 Tax=Cyberlindnera fabianii TaxID=36022 RepID=A0A061AXR3_CYBFA|nr:FACT complex subunit SPT16 [Cyberlindnera fabianii]CDR42361.1 CYFA0S09e01970g1_1 [Cyberlindnera fabianii]